MGKFSRIKKEAVTVAKIETDFTHDDERLARRWKRRGIEYQNSSKAPKDIIINNNQENDSDMEIIAIDSDYENFLNNIDQSVVADDLDSVDDNVNCDVPLTLEKSHDGDMSDPQYMMFLDNLKEDGNSYVLTLSFGSDAPLVVKYEKEDDNAPRRKNKEARNTLRNNRSSNVPIINRKVPVVEKSMELEPDSVFHCPTNDCMSDLMDESYQVFLDSLEYDGQNFVYAPQGGENLLYEKEASDSDSEVVILDANPFAETEYDPFVSSKAYLLSIDVDGEGCAGSLSRSKETQYRSKLMEILQKPYDLKELNDLMRKASERMPLERPLELRGGREVKFRIGSLGKSYFDKHSDLARAIHEVGDKRKVLNVLRGFFFWLQNVSFEGGAFKPWLDAECLEVLPRVTQDVSL